MSQPDEVDVKRNPLPAHASGALKRAHAACEVHSKYRFERFCQQFSGVELQLWLRYTEYV